MALAAESKGFVRPWRQIWRKSHCQINRDILGTRRSINLLKQWNHIWYSSCTWSHHLVYLTTIHCHCPRSVCLLHRLNKRVEWGCGGNHHRCVFQALISAVPPGMQYCFFPPCFPNRISSNGFYLAFPTILVLMPQVRELMWEFCQLLSMPIPIMHLELEKHHGMGLGTHWTHCEMGLSRTPLITWPLYAPTLTAGPLWYSGFLEISVNSEPVSNNIWKFWFFFFQNFSYPGEDHRSLWRRQGERLTVYIFGSVSDPSSRIPSLITINKKKTGKSIENQAK